MLPSILRNIIVVDHIKVATTATIEAILMSVEGSRAITTPKKPTMIAVHLLHQLLHLKNYS